MYCICIISFHNLKTKQISNATFRLYNSLTFLMRNKSDHILYLMYSLIFSYDRGQIRDTFKRNSNWGQIKVRFQRYSNQLMQIWVLIKKNWNQIFICLLDQNLPNFYTRKTDRLKQLIWKYNEIF